MATHNYVSLLGQVRKAAIVKQSEFGETAVCAVTVIRGTRDDNEKMVENQQKYSSPIVMSEDSVIIKEMLSWEELDIVRITCFIATREVEKASLCPNCGAENLRRESCVLYGSKSGGNRIYIYPIFAEKVRSFSEQGESYRYIIERAEISNRVFLLGNLTRDPIQGIMNGSKNIYTRYQIAINRKYCAKGMEDIYERTDYPWIYSYGEKAQRDFKLLKTGSLIYVDGAIQTRKYKETYICGNCGTEYLVPGRTMEILSYDTEYLNSFDHEKEK